MTNPQLEKGRGRARKLIAGLRVTTQDEALLEVVRPFLGDTESEGELAYRLWRRGLEVTLAEVASLGVPLPPGSSEELIAGLVAQRLLLCAPLLRRTGRLALLGINEPSSLAVTPPEAQLHADPAIDGNASAVVAGLGGSDFL